MRGTSTSRVEARTPLRDARDVEQARCQPPRSREGVMIEIVGVLIVGMVAGVAGLCLHCLFGK